MSLSHQIASLIFIILATTSALPDSAGIVAMVPGLAYGGIPYGSVSGMLLKYQNNPIDRADYPGYYQPQIQQNNRQTRTHGIVVTPNYRAAGLEARRRGPVQIYTLPGVVAPGVVGTFSQIGY